MIDWLKRRFRLWKICRALEIKPTKWQSKFAMRRSNHIPTGRGTGKTTAVVLRALVEDAVNARELYDILRRDPNFMVSTMIKLNTYNQWRSMAEICQKKGLRITGRISRRQFSEEIFRNKEDWGWN